VLSPELSSSVAPDPLTAGLTLHADGTASFRVWAPHAASVLLRLKEGYKEVHLNRDHDNFDMWSLRLAPGALTKGSAYKVLICTHDGQKLERRDPYAHQTEYSSEWCFVDDPTAFKWSPHTLLPFEETIIYEMHVGSFTPVGTLAAAMDKLEHIQQLGFTQVQLMPLTEHSDAWGYNPRQLLSLHGGFGTPDDLRRFVDRAHQLGMGVIIDVVLHHGAVDGNALWEYDGWGPNWNGGIYHEGGHDTQWGRAFGFWKKEVRDMIYASCQMWLRDYNCDGLRFDSANDLPADMVKELTWKLREHYPGRILTAEVTPENPMSVRELGFDSVWVHSGYFDIIQQHRALGRGHHGGGDWAAGWDLPRMRTVMILHFGFEKPTQCIKYLLGSHDQVGCRKGGAWYKDYEMIGGQHRYAVDQFGGGRTDPHATANARLWYAANVAAAGLPMMFMGTEYAQGGWWDITEHRRLQWALSEDAIGKQMIAAVSAANKLRQEYVSLRRGWANILHEDRPNGIVAFERVCDGEPRIVCVINAGRSSFQEGQYGCWVGGGSFEEIYSSHDPVFGGWDVKTNGGGVKHSHEGKLYLNVPPQCCLIFKQVYEV
jgi:1,4-alpha-glucan branching enzyme